MKKTILYIATSQDGFIADKKGGVDLLPHPDDANDASDEVGFEVLLGRISTIVMGSGSYHQILGFGKWAWDDKQTYVFTSQSLETSNASITFVQERPKIFIEQLKRKPLEGHIWLLGGAELIKSFAKEKLIDECIITVIPMNLGEGIKLELPYEDFILTQTKMCSAGMVQKSYLKK